MAARTTSMHNRMYGSQHQKLRAWWDEQIQAAARPQCYRCAEPIGPGKAWQLDHMDDGPRAWVPIDQDRWPSHKACNLGAGAAKGNARRGATIFGSDHAPDPALQISSLSEPAEPSPVDPRLAWTPSDLRFYPWLADLADVPEDASAPLMMSPVPDDAVCSYAWDGCTHAPAGGTGIAWIEQTQKITLRWWQRLSVTRQLEHRADLSLCFREKDESAPRRSGKSIGMKGQALWRLQFGEVLFGEVQTIIHTGSDMAICREIQRQAWRWSESVQWVVTRGNGKEAIETPAGDRWLVRAQDAVYGYDVCLGMVDEVWNVKPDTVSEGLEPATLERQSPQLVLTSTAHRRATSLMRSKLVAAMSLADPGTLLLLWGAPMGSDPSDPAVWRAASPYWSEDRAQYIAAKYAKAASGQDDPEFDDPDPMKGFEAQYLNIWRVKEPRQVGRPVVDSEAWGRIIGTIPERVPDAVAMESWFDEGVSVARAWVQADGPVIVAVVDCPDMPTAVETAASYGSDTIRAGASLAEHAAWESQGIEPEKATGGVRANVAELAAALKEHRFVHARSGVLTEQVLALRVAEGVDGPRVVSKGRADAVKAAVWAVTAALEVGTYNVMDSIL
ncbi:hypothetical protein [Occultella gossypii]|uniref:Terminase n=1 Tax=Occultella gossypii TaxID=2800820 RepID=A0ABS7SAA3_9MICO|nr:hypothetical protein [Occultella gossypii]MBZ2197265.1 hypothetical protein [Occultella gossypii]